MVKIIIFTDGGSRGNPGPAAAGAVIDAGKERLICGKFLGVNTNNFAEYSAVIIALERLLEEGQENPTNMQINLFADSLLVVKQLNGEFKVKNANIKPLYEKVKLLESNFGLVSYFHIPREKNKEADAQVNRILDEVKRAA